MSGEASGYLLDTNILFYLMQGKSTGQQIEARYQIRARPSRSIISIVTRGELLSLALQRSWGEAKVAELRRLLDQLIQIAIDDQAIVEAYAEIDNASHRSGYTMAKNDLWIAATARASGLTLLASDHHFDHLHGTWIDRIWIDPDTSKPT